MAVHDRAQERQSIDDTAARSCTDVPTNDGSWRIAQSLLLLKLPTACLRYQFTHTIDRRLEIEPDARLLVLALSSLGEVCVPCVLCENKRACPS